MSLCATLWLIEVFLATLVAWYEILANKSLYVDRCIDPEFGDHATFLVVPP